MSLGKLLGGTLVALLALAFVSFGPSLVGANFGTVVPGRVYRSAQLEPSELEHHIEQEGLRAIVNLRGPRNDREWYRKERDVARRHDVVLLDIDLVPERLPPRPAVVALLDGLETLPEPILIHCSAGADRTGFASVVAKMSIGGATYDEARDEMSLRYGHLPFGPASEIARIFDLFEEHRNATSAKDDFATFERWARTTYVPYAYSARWEVTGLPSSAASGSRLDLAVAVVNTSSEPWILTRDPDRGIKLGVRLRKAGGEWIDYDRHGQIDRVVAPGEMLRLGVPIWAPREAGRYELELDMVDEHVTWFQEQGSNPLAWTLEVEDLENEPPL
jgi:protein tyrosine/serine phosphatase